MIALRHRCDVEVGNDSDLSVMAQYPTDPDQQPPVFGPVAPCWRVMPWEIVAFLELKGLKTKLEQHIERLAYYCEDLLQISPGRRVVFGAITNFEECRFVAAAVCVINGKLTRYAGPTISDAATVARELAHFLTTPVELLHATFRFPTEVMQPMHPLGRGSTGSVMAVRPQTGQKLVAKVSADPYALEVERIILQYLHSRNADLPIPCIAEDQQFDLAGAVRPSGSTLVHCNLFQHEFEKLPEGLVTAERLCALWDGLTAVHALGVVHCDLRTPNVRYDRERDVLVLLDWGASRGYSDNAPALREELYQPGGLINASPAVRKYIRSTGDDRKFPCLPADEAVSMIYLTFQFLFPTFDNIHVAPASADDADRRWRSALYMLAADHFKHNRNNPIAMTIQELQDEENRTTLSPAELSQRVHSAIRLLFQVVCGAPSC